MNQPEPRTILHVEDNAVNAFLVEAIFAEHPAIRLVTATSGMIGLELAQSERPDLILLDLNLPDIAGEEFLSRLRAAEATAAIPIVIVERRWRWKISGPAVLRLNVADFVTEAI